MELVRFFTAGNVDDGKSTLIGRLLYDSHSISTDIIETLTKQSKTNESDTSIDLALLTDGLRAEREQGITIDVAYKYFSSKKRKYIIADTPGHAQYTRNMFTGASTADLAIILIDARNGITDQTKRHSIISSILGIPQVLICMNKMDLVDYSQDIFNNIKSEFATFASMIGLKNVSYIPVSALKGENVVHPSAKMDWYHDGSLFHFLENLIVKSNEIEIGARFQVQYVIRPQTNLLPDYRGYAGSLLSGKFRKGDEVVILPHEGRTKIQKIEKHQQEVPVAQASEPIVLHLEDDFDVSRGTTIVKSTEMPNSSDIFEAIICWMDNKPFQKGQKLLLQHHSFRIKAAIKEIIAEIEIHKYENLEGKEELKLNDIAKVLIKLAEPIHFDSYDKNRNTGSFILINENTNNTVSAGVICV